MRWQTLGDKPGIAVEQIRSGEASVTIKKGAPVFLQLSGTENGLRVVSAESLAAALQVSFWGLALTDVVAGALGESILYGYYPFARYIYTTRAASTDVWASYSAGAIGDVLGFRTTLGDQCLTRSVAAAATAFQPMIILAETYASQTTQASSVSATNDTRTASTAAIKVVLRGL